MILGLWSALQLFRPGASPKLRTKAWLDGVLVWGFLAFLNGLLGAVVGIILMFQAIEAAGAIRTTVMAPGIKQTLLDMGFGTMTLGFAVFFWFVLQLRWRLLKAAAADAEG
ncbi:MotA/TolQ/ExbB proton channel family protein [Gemmatimonadota bacterium]